MRRDIGLGVPAAVVGLERSAVNPGGGDYSIRVIGLGLAGRFDEARDVLRTMTQMARIQDDRKH